MYTQQNEQSYYRNYAAHEFLETQEELRTKAANLELYGLLFAMAKDTHLKDILYNQQRRMLESYNYGVQLVQGRAASMLPHTPQLRIYEQPQTGMERQQMATQPNPNATELSDMTIATLALQIHKNGAVNAMRQTLECVDEHIRRYHATCANICQEMSYEIYQYMNYRGFYPTPQLANHTMWTMTQGIQQASEQQPYQTHFHSH
ncbi:spore coat protein [Paenibacillus chartarius]|uniref:Spore coat protein n=1 Tax=Paenibacillus chartarius TaxID=747481 RepID=A0ABV6DEU1_9BACL